MINEQSGEIMLFAYAKDGKKIRAKNDLPHVSEGGEYRCTYKWCPHPEMILRKGTHTIPHFAHKIAGGCDELSEAETERHLQIKDFMQAFLKVDIDAMEYSEIEGVRPDIHYDGKFVIELQCSAISDRDMVKRDAIYIKNGKTPIWMFDIAEFGDDAKLPAYWKRDRRLRVAERYALLMHGCLFYFSIDTEHKTPEGYPIITIYRIVYNRINGEFARFRRAESTTIQNLEEFKALLTTIATRCASFKDQIMDHEGYDSNHLYWLEESKWILWGKCVKCVEKNDIIGECGRLFHISPESTQDKCTPCLEAELLKRWKEIEPNVHNVTVSLESRTLIITGEFKFDPYISIDDANASVLFVRFSKLDQMHSLLKFPEETYNQIKCQYDNQLNKVNTRLHRDSPSVVQFRVTTLLRPRKTKAHAEVEAD